MLEIESTKPFDPEGKTFAPALPFENAALWRGQNGVQAAVSFDAFARQLLGRRGAFELTVGFRHESEHFTGSNSGGPGPQEYVRLPHIGDFFLQDVAVRLPFGNVDLELRLQNKIFLPVDAGIANVYVRAYVLGPGGDVILRRRLRDWIHPYTSTFVEYGFGKRNFTSYDRVYDVPDYYLVRNLIGVIFPAVPRGGVQLFTSIAIGHGKGFLVLREEFLWGGGARISLF